MQVNRLGRDDRRAALVHGRTWPYRHGGGKTPKLELGSAFFMAGWGRAVRVHDGEAMDALNGMEVIVRWVIGWCGSTTAAEGQREKERDGARQVGSARPRLGGI